MATQLPSSSLLLLSLAASLLLPASCQFTPPSVTNYDLPVATWIFYKALEWLGHNEPSKMHIKTLFMDQFNDINDHLSAVSFRPKPRKRERENQAKQPTNSNPIVHFQNSNRWLAGPAFSMRPTM